MDCEVALYFRNEFREARAVALKDAEGYQQILFVLERFGAYMFGGGCCKTHDHKKRPSLGAYKECIKALVNEYHPLEKEREVWPSYRDCHTTFDSLYEMVRQARNDALHQGAVARNLTSHSVQLSLMLEDALMRASKSEQIKDYMVRNPVYAYAWQPVSFVRQMMLENSFSYIPVCMKKKCAEEKVWHIIADYHIAAYLRLADGDGCRKKLLAKSIKDAIGSNEMAREEAFPACPDEKIQDVLKRYVSEQYQGKPILVVNRDNCDELLGIATPFDLM